MTQANRYSYQLLTSPFARDHALHCLNTRPDDFVKEDSGLYFKTIEDIHDYESKGYVFLIIYESGTLVNNVFVATATEGGPFFCHYGISAPQDGGLSYTYGTIFLEALDFFASQGHTEYNQKYVVNGGSGKILRHYADKSDTYNFYFDEQEGYPTGDLRIDLVNLKGDE